MVIGARFLRAIILNKLLKKRTPIMANLFITNRCHLRCFYCYADVNNGIEDLKKQDIFHIIDELKKLGTVMVVLLGGEPLLRKDIGKIIDYVADKKMMCEVLTSGYKIAERIADLKKLDSICISIDGDEYNHDLNRGKGSYKTAIKALKIAISNNIQTRIHSTITRNNLSSIDHVANLSKKYNVKLNCALASAHTDNNALNFTNEEIRNFYVKLKKYKQEGYPISNAYSTLDYLIKWPGSFSFIAEEADVRFQNVKLIPCKRKDFTCYIDTDGSLYPCATKWNKYHAMNIKKAGVKRSWDALVNLKCKSCITEVEVNMLFNANFKSLINVASYVFVDKIKNFKINRN